MANCSDITKFGIFDISTTSREEDLITSYLQWLDNQEVNSSQAASSLSASFGIPFPELPLDFGFGNDNNNASSWSKQLTEYLENNVEAKTRFRQEFIAANSTIVNAWRDCVLNKRGLVCWAEQTENPREILLKIDLRLLVIPAPAPIKITQIITSPNVMAQQNYLGETLGAETHSILFRRIGDEWNEAVNFNVITSDPNYRDSCTVARIHDVTDCRNSKGLLAYWSADGNGNDSLGKYNGIVSHGVSFVEGMKGRAFKFDGDVGIVVTPLIVSYQEGVTFEAYIKTNDDSGMIMTDGGGASAGKGMGLFIEPGGTINLFGSKGTEADFNFIVRGPVVNDGKYYDIVGTWTGDTQENGVVLYLDGVAVGFGNAKESINKGSTPLYFGRHNTLGYFPFAGIIDEVKVYNRALQSGEII